MEGLRACICGRKEGPKIREVEEDENADHITAPKDDDAAISILAARGLIEPLESEWPEPDEGWLDRIVIGKMSRRAKKNVTAADFLGVLLISNPAPVAAVTGESERATGVQGSFLWTKWAKRYPDLKVDTLHLLSLNVNNDLPIESIDLGKLNAAPAVMQMPVEEGPDKLALLLDFGMQIDELVVHGKEQITRWVNGVKAALLATLASSASELDPESLVEELQKFDRTDTKRHEDEAYHKQNKLIMDFAKSQEDDPDAQWDTFNEKDSGLDWKKPLSEQVKTLLDSKEHEVDLSSLLETLSRAAVLPRLLVTAAVRREPPRKDVLNFWKDVYHVRFCNALETVWNERVKVMTCSELADFAWTIDTYKKWLTSVYIEDTSLHDGVCETAEVYARRTYPSLVSLAQNVADFAVIKRKRQDGGAYCSSAPVDLLMFLGGVSEVALEGPMEMRQSAAKVVDGALYKYKKRLKARLQVVEKAKNPGLLFIHCAALLTDAEEFADRIQRMLGEISGDITSAGNIFTTVEGRFREAAEVYCEKLVTITLQRTNACLEFGNPPEASKVWELGKDLRRLVREVFIPAMETLQEALDEPWRSRFAVRFITRFVAFEIYVLLFCRSSGSPPNTTKISTALQGHSEELKAAAAVWVEKDMQKVAETRANALSDISALISCDKSKLEQVMEGVRLAHSGGFTKDVAHKVLELRGDLDEETRSKISGKAAEAEQSRKSKSRKSYFAVEDITLTARQGASPFDSVIDHKWVEELIAELPSRLIGGATSPEWNRQWVTDGEDALQKAGGLVALNSGRAAKNDKQTPQNDAPDIDDFLADIELSDSDEDAGKESGAKGDDIAVGKVASAEPVQAAAKKDKPEEKEEDDWKSNSDLWSESSFKPSEDEDEDDEVVRGYLYKQDTLDTKKIVEEDRDAGKGMFAQMGDVMAGAFNAARGGWKKKFFQVSQDMRQNRNLCWYREMTDLVAEGSVFLTEIGKVTKDEQPSHRLKYILRLDILDINGGVAQVLELRTEYENEQTMWNNKLDVLLKRQLAAFEMVTERTGIVYRPDPSLKIRDPEHLGMASRKKIVGAAKAVSRLQKAVKATSAAKPALKGTAAAKPAG